MIPKQLLGAVPTEHMVIPVTQVLYSSLRHLFNKDEWKAQWKQIKRLYLPLLLQAGVPLHWCYSSSNDAKYDLDHTLASSDVDF